ncbi:MAG TPA: DUF4440 domain-containing protein [Steroidobacteraceae bacterium]
MNWMRWICLLAVLALAGRDAAAADLRLTAAECEVWEREQSFAGSVARHDEAAFAAHVHEGAVFGAASPQTQSGRDSIVKAWSDLIEGKGVSLEWRPQFVSIAAGADVAMSRGPYVMTTRDEQGKRHYAIGEFVSVWMRKDASSPWMVMLDGGGPPPTRATEEEARRHLDSAPRRCPRSEG